MSPGESPSEHLAQEVVEALCESGLLRLAKKEAVAAKIAAGTMKAGEWQLEIELAAAQAGDD